MPTEEICTITDATQPNWAAYARDPDARLKLLLALIEQAQLIEVIAFSLLAHEVDDTPAPPVITNVDTGERMTLKDGQWLPL
jgi:hypothetical protein